MSDVQHELQLDAQQQNSLAQQLAKSSRQRRNFFRNLVEGRVFEKELSLEETRQVFDLYNGYHDELLLKLLSSDTAMYRNVWWTDFCVVTKSGSIRADPLLFEGNVSAWLRLD